LDRPTGGKTGTNNGPRDTWFVGFTPTLVAGIWTGNDDNRVMRHEAGGRTAATLWREFMERVLEPYRGEDFPRPEESFVTVRICSVSGEPAGPWCPHSEPHYFLPQEAPGGVCSLHQGPPVVRATCAESGELITPYCPLESRQFRYFYANAQPSKPCPVHGPGADGLIAAAAASPPRTQYVSAAADADAHPSPPSPARSSTSLSDFARRLGQAFEEAERKQLSN
jgi:membrane peptidoglycan carboxypeptidase